MTYRFAIKLVMIEYGEPIIVQFDIEKDIEQDIRVSDLVKIGGDIWFHVISRIVDVRNEYQNYFDTSPRSFSSAHSFYSCLEEFKYHYELKNFGFSHNPSDAYLLYRLYRRLFGNKESFTEVLDGGAKERLSHFTAIFGFDLDVDVPFVDLFDVMSDIVEKDPVATNVKYILSLSDDDVKRIMGLCDKYYRIGE